MKESRGDKLFLISTYIYLCLALLVILYPLIYILSASISSPQDVNSGAMWLFPKNVTLDGYKLVFENPKIWNGYWNTIIYTVVGTLVNLAVTLPASYALSRSDFVGRQLFMGLILFTMFFSGGLVPTYLLVKNLGLINSMWALILPVAASVWNIVVARTFFRRPFQKSCRKRRISTAVRI